MRKNGLRTTAFFLEKNRKSVVSFKSTKNDQKPTSIKTSFEIVSNSIVAKKYKTFL